MPKRVPLQSIVVQRDGANTCPPIGHPFEFTAAEIEQIEAINPAALTSEATVDLAKSDAPTKGKAGKSAEGGDL